MISKTTVKEILFTYNLIDKRSRRKYEKFVYFLADDVKKELDLLTYSKTPIKDLKRVLFPSLSPCKVKLCKVEMRTKKGFVTIANINLNVPKSILRNGSRSISVRVGGAKEELAHFGDKVRGKATSKKVPTPKRTSLALPKKLMKVKGR
jgi:hypothetical protein